MLSPLDFPITNSLFSFFDSPGIPFNEIDSINLPSSELFNSEKIIPQVNSLPFFKYYQKENFHFPNNESESNEFPYEQFYLNKKTIKRDNNSVNVIIEEKKIKECEEEIKENKRNQDPNENKDLNNFTRKKRGRAKNLESKRKTEHTKFSKDNMKRKIQVHYITFLVKYLNLQIRKYLNKKHPLFTNLSYDFKKNISKIFFKKLKQKTVGEILKNKESTKNKNNKVELSENNNEKVFESVYNKSEQIRKILDRKYLDLFKELYAYNVFDKDKENKGEKDKEEFKGLLLFDDLIKKGKMSNENDKSYEQKMLKLCQKEFVEENKIFKIKAKGVNNKCKNVKVKSNNSYNSVTFFVQSDSGNSNTKSSINLGLFRTFHSSSISSFSQF